MVTIGKTNGAILQAPRFLSRFIQACRQVRKPGFIGLPRAPAIDEIEKDACVRNPFDMSGWTMDEHLLFGMK